MYTTKKDSAMINFIPGFHQANADAIENALKVLVDKKLKSQWTTRNEKEALRDIPEHSFISVAKQLEVIISRLHDTNAGVRAKTVFAKCVKEPKNLDSGRHYYSLYFVNYDGGIQRFWPYELWPLFYMKSQDRDRSMPKYIFYSGAIGMSRLLDATDGFFGTIRDISGYYSQVDEI